MAMEFTPLKDKMDTRYLRNFNISLGTSIMLLLYCYIMDGNSLVDINFNSAGPEFGLLFFCIFALLTMPKGASFENVTEHANLEFVEDHDSGYSLYAFKGTSKHTIMIGVFFSHGVFDLEYDVSLWFHNKQNDYAQKLPASELAKFIVDTELSIERSLDEPELQNWINAIYQDAKRLSYIK